MRLFNSIAIDITPTRIWFGAMWLIAGWSTLGAAALYLWELNWVTMAVAVLLPVVGLRFLLPKKTLNEITDRGAASSAPTTRPTIPWSKIILAGIYATAAALWVIGLMQSATVEAIRSPWTLIPVWAVVAFAIATFCLVGLVWQAETLRATSILIMISVHAFLALSAAWIVYQIGYGFDPFIHQKAEEIIAASGSLLPKTPYYLGQYALVVMTNKLLGLPIGWVDKLAGPFLFAIAVPTAAFIGIRNWARQRLAPTTATVGIAAILLIPLGQFIATTPQGVGYVWFITTVLLGMAALGDGQRATKQVAPTDELHLHWYHLLPFALAAMAAHPIAGIPAMAYVAFIWIWQSNLAMWKRWVAVAAISAIAVFGIPLAFAMFSSTNASNQPAAMIDAPAGGVIQQVEPLIEWHPYSDWLSTVDLVVGNNVVWLIILAAMGIIWVYRERNVGAQGRAQRAAPLRPLLIPAWFAILMALSAGVWKYLGNFNFLIAYERADYPERLLNLAMFSLMPLSLIGAAALIGKLWSFSATARMVVIVGLTVNITANVYAAYPRFDRYQADRGYSTSIYDFEAAHQIDQDAAGQPYIVLSNQAVSAAAIKTFGFEPRYNGLNRYAVPTGGPLYQVYLKMVYDSPTRANAKLASELTGVKVVYFVVNDYWYQSEQIKNVAKQEADRSFMIGGGRVNVFKYVF